MKGLLFKIYYFFYDILVVIAVMTAKENKAK